MTHQNDSLVNRDKKREVGCIRCNYIIITGEPAPVCEICEQPLVVVLYSSLTGMRITGNELDTKGRRPT